MKVVFVKYMDSSDESLYDFFTLKKSYEVIEITRIGNFCVISDVGSKSIIFKSECIEENEYKKQLIKERFEQKNNI